MQSELGRRLGELPVSTDTAGFARLLDWASRSGVEGTAGARGGLGSGEGEQQMSSFWSSG